MIRIGVVGAAVVVCSSVVGASVVGPVVVVVVVVCRSEVARVFAEALAFRACLRLLCLAVLVSGLLRNLHTQIPYKLESTIWSPALDERVVDQQQI